MSKQKGNILILGASTQSAVYVARQYKKFGLTVSIVDWHNVPINKSKYIDYYFSIGSPIEDYSGFAQNLIKLISENKYDCILPIHDPAVQVCLEHFDSISIFTKIIGVNKQEVQLFAHNKWKLIEIATEVGIKVPESFLISKIDDVDHVLSKISFPCIIKPESSSLISNNRVLELRVNLVNSKEELIDLVRENINTVNLIVQEYLEGYGIGYNIISNNGKILNAYIHRRINENKGVSSYRETLPVSTYGLQPLITALVKEINWSGVAMIEFRITNDGQPYLMEINGRFWGSIELGIKSGLNYPVQLYEMQVLNKEIESNISFDLIKVRNLREEIFLNLAKLTEGKLSTFFKWFFSLSNIFRNNDYIEDNIFDDSSFVLALYKRDVMRIINKFLNRLKSIDRKIIRIPQNKQYNIAFVCLGNICRSPFAERYARKKFPKHNYISIGTIPVEKRMSPINALIAAKKFDVDLSDFLSVCLSKNNTINIEYFIVMDKKNYSELIRAGIDKTKIYFLSEHDIEDPYKNDIDYFIARYKEIANSIDKNIGNS